tara:strand:+ start:6176 stop:6463 length:288 start_codon:yes stop_codon:yes gene_type:complete
MSAVKHLSTLMDTTRLDQQSILLKLHSSLVDKREYLFRSYSENMNAQHYEQASNDWAKYEGYCEATSKVFDFIMELDLPRQLELNLLEAELHDQI